MKGVRDQAGEAAANLDVVRWFFGMLSKRWSSVVQIWDIFWWKTRRITWVKKIVVFLLTVNFTSCYKWTFGQVNSF